MTHLPVLMVPGWTGSGPEHWQAQWLARIRAGWLEQSDRDRPDPEGRVEALEDAAERLAEPPLVVAHSLGCLVAVRAAADGTRLRGAFLVAPPDVEAPGAPAPLRAFAPIPMDPLPCPSVLVYSRSDPWITVARTKELGRAWGSETVDAGAQGHLNTASGHGPWPEGLALLRAFASRLGAELREPF